MVTLYEAMSHDLAKMGARIEQLEFEADKDGSIGIVFFIKFKQGMTPTPEQVEKAKKILMAYNKLVRTTTLKRWE